MKYLNTKEVLSKVRIVENASIEGLITKEEAVMLKNNVIDSSVAPSTLRLIRKYLSESYGVLR